MGWVSIRDGDQGGNNIGNAVDLNKAPFATARGHFATPRRAAAAELRMTHPPAETHGSR